jgi:hypothetical protein
VLSIFDAGTRERAAAASLRRLDKPTRAEIRRRVGALIVEPMRREAGRRARNARARAVAATARASWYKDVPGVAFGGARAVLSDGTTGRAIARGTEYGSRGDRYQRVTTHTPAGRAYVARRRQTAGFRPRTDSGAWATPAALAVAPDVVDAWAAIVVEATIDALDGKG